MHKPCWCCIKSYLERYDPNVRAGLGTSLLLEGIFRDEDGDSDPKESLLMARYHLRVASFLCSTAPRTTESASTEVAEVGEVNIFSGIPKKLLRVDDETAATNAAILHNLALAHIGKHSLVDGHPLSGTQCPCFDDYPYVYCSPFVCVRICLFMPRRRHDTPTLAPLLPSF